LHEAVTTSAKLKRFATSKFWIKPKLKRFGSYPSFKFRLLIFQHSLREPWKLGVKIARGCHDVREA
jgi:hypothetical protein